MHGTVLGVGERVGNTPIDLLLVNMRLQGAFQRDVACLAELVALTSKAMQVPIPFDYPVFGPDAFRTATGVHAAAIIKATERDHEEWVDRIYSGVPAAWFGREQQIDVGPMSGKSNVRHWLDSHGIEASEEAVLRILEAAKAADTVLSDAEIRQLLR